MGVDENKEVARRYFAAANRGFQTGDFAALDDLFAPGAVEHLRTMGLPPDVGGLKLLLQAVRAAAPDVQATIEDVVAEGDTVVIRHRHRGTLTGEFMGAPAPPTGRAFDFPGIEIARVAGGRIAESWHVDDLFGFLQQVGALPSPDRPPAGTPPAA